MVPHALLSPSVCSDLYSEVAKVQNGILAPTVNPKVITWKLNWAKNFPAVTQLPSKGKQLCLLHATNLFCIILFYYAERVGQIKACWEKALNG